MPSAFLFATLDTKGREADHVDQLLTSWNIPVTLVDVAALRSPPPQCQGTLMRTTAPLKRGAKGAGFGQGGLGER